MLAGIVALMLRSGAGDLDVLARTLLGGAHAGRPFSAFWFVSVLFCTMVFARIVDRFPIVAQCGLAGVGLVAISWQPGLLAHTPLGIGLAPGYLTFVLFGRWLRRSDGVWPARPTSTALAGAALMVAGSVVVALGWSAPLDLKQGDLGTPVVGVVVAAALTAGPVLVAVAARGLVRGRIAAAATTLAGAGICAVLAHPGVLFVLRTPESGRVMDLALALVLPWLLGVLALRTPLSGWVNGVERRPSGPAARRSARHRHAIG